MHKPRILAIDLRSQRFGFAVLEGTARLVDSGIKVMNGAGTHADLLRKRLHPLLAFYLPSAVVVNLRSDGRRSSQVMNTKLLEIIKSGAKQYSAEFIVLTRADIRRAFLQSGKRSKDEIAAFIAGSFPDIGWKLPPSRKNWQAEHHTMTMFDAISVGLAYLVQLGYALRHHPKHLHSSSPG